MTPGFEIALAIDLVVGFALGYGVRALELRPTSVTSNSAGSLAFIEAHSLNAWFSWRANGVFFPRFRSVSGRYYDHVVILSSGGKKALFKMLFCNRHIIQTIEGWHARLRGQRTVSPSSPGGNC